MIKLTRKTTRVDNIDATLTLPLHNRIKSRLRVVLDNGADAGFVLERGSVLKDGDVLSAEDGFSVLVQAAKETLSVVVSDDRHLLARACYHLGNRHVAIQIEPDQISYLHDHVLDEMLSGLGLDPTTIEAAFEPEPGAYGGSATKGHGHDHHH